jgi:alpha-tubulin N-acetyltransferase 1
LFEIQAQDLPSAITSYLRLAGQEQRLYLKVDGRKAIGLLKVGPKNLFYRDPFGGVKELKPICVLDFYVHESAQRGGIGKVFFHRK